MQEQSEHKTPSSRFTSKASAKAPPRVTETAYDVTLNASNPRSKTRVLDANGRERYLLTFEPQFGGPNDPRFVSWHAALADVRHQMYKNVLMPSLDPLEDKLQVWYLNPSPYALAGFRAIRVIKVENFYCSLQVTNHSFVGAGDAPLGVDHGKCSVLKQQPAERRRKTVATVWQSLTSLRWKARERIPAVMSAAVYRGIDDVRLETVPVPAIGPGEILVRVHTCGICGTDLKKISTGSHPPPRIFGHETSGVVAAIGRGVDRFAVGDRVMVFHHIPCGECYYCHHKTFAQCETYKKVGCTAGFRIRPVGASRNTLELWIGSCKKAQSKCLQKHPMSRHVSWSR